MNPPSKARAKSPPNASFPASSSPGKARFVLDFDDDSEATEPPLSSRSRTTQFSSSIRQERPELDSEPDRDLSLEDDSSAALDENAPPLDFPSLPAASEALNQGPSSVEPTRPEGPSRSAFFQTVRAQFQDVREAALARRGQNALSNSSSQLSPSLLSSSQRGSPQQSSSLLSSLQQRSPQSSPQQRPSPRSGPPAAQPVISEKEALPQRPGKSPTVRRPWLGPALMLSVAFGAYALSSSSLALLAPQLSRSAPRVPDLGSLTPASAAKRPGVPEAARPSSGGTVATTRPASVEPVIESAPLPSGAAFPGRGLLEVVTNERELIYVDGIFIGRGPLRQIPLLPGPHAILIRNGGKERVATAELRVGASTRVHFEVGLLPGLEAGAEEPE